MNPGHLAAHAPGADLFALFTFGVVLIGLVIYRGCKR